jgi:hypothetical protein
MPPVGFVVLSIFLLWVPTTITAYSKQKNVWEVPFRTPVVGGVHTSSWFWGVDLLLNSCCSATDLLERVGGFSVSWRGRRVGVVLAARAPAICRRSTS